MWNIIPKFKGWKWLLDCMRCKTLNYPEFFLLQSTEFVLGILSPLWCTGMLNMCAKFIEPRVHVCAYTAARVFFFVCAVKTVYQAFQLSTKLFWKMVALMSVVAPLCFVVSEMIIFAIAYSEKHYGAESTTESTANYTNFAGTYANSTHCVFPDVTSVYER